MKEQLQDKLVEVIGAVQASAGKAGEFALTQLPQIAQEYVVYGRVKTVVFSSVLLVLGITFISAAVWAYKNPWNTSPYSIDKGKERSDSNMLAMFFGSGLGGLAIVAALLTFNYLVWFAPKVWLLKELATLTK